jgi:hypothetical protein
VPDAPDLAFDDMEVVEQPFRRRGNELTAVDVVREDAIGLAQRAGVVPEAREERVGPAARVAGQGEAGGENPGSFLQTLDAQQLGGERLLDLRAAAGPEEARSGRREMTAARCEVGVCGSSRTRPPSTMDANRATG